MKTITLALQKGGTGKTSMSVTLAAELAKHGKTLLIDADPQGNATTWIGNNAQIQFELADLLNGKQPLEKVIRPTGTENLFIVPTAGLGGDLREYQTSKAGGQPNAFLDITDIAQKQFAYCVIDTAPNFDPLNTSVFIATDEIMTVLQFNEFSKDGLQIFTDNLITARKNHRIPKEKAVLNKIILNAKDERIKQQSDLQKTFMQLEQGGYSLFVIPIDQAFNKSQAMHCTIQDLAGTKKETLQAIESIIKAVM